MIYSWLYKPVFTDSRRSYSGLQLISNQQSAISNQQSAISNQQSSNHSPPLVTAFGRCSPWSLAALVARVSIRGIRPGLIIRWITSFIVLAALFFVLPASCDDPNTNGGSTNGGGGVTADDIDGDGVMNSADVDDDNDRLIEIRNLDMFDNIRNNLAGTGYDDGSGSPPDDMGCPVAGCNGYELMTNLDFAEESSYASGSENWTNKTWRPVDSTSTVVAPNDAVNAGFPGIGADSGDDGGFNAIFEGNGKTISNFYSRNAGYIGLFRSTDSTAQIRSLGVTNGNVYGGAGDDDNVGVLAGLNRGTIIASSASGSADGGAGTFDVVGGLVGQNEGTIIASYATGSADGGDGNNNLVGGLVGRNNGGITASYATGSADGGVRGSDNVGGLVGWNETGSTIIASYATGSADGGAGTFDNVGGLVGWNSTGATITASYASGSADGGADGFDNVGGLVGRNNEGITASYGFGTVTNEENAGSAGSTLPTIAGVAITSATQLGDMETATTGDAGTSASLFWWNEASSTGAGAWDFGTATENPALVYSDYDGPSGNTYPSCSDAEGLFLTIPGTTTQIVCGTTLIGGFRAP